MSYDGPMPSFPRRPLARGDDLETIVTLLELAAIYLTSDPDSKFTRDQLLSKAREVGGPEIELRDRDFDNVLSNARFFARLPGGLYRLK